MMVVSGNELIKMIDRKEHINTRFYIRLIYDETVPGGLDDVYRNREFVIDKFGNIFTDDDIAKIKDINIFRKSFFVIKGYEEIDIDNLTEINLLSEPNIWEKINIITQNINELIKAVKQLNKKLEEK